MIRSSLLATCLVLASPAFAEKLSVPVPCTAITAESANATLLLFGSDGAQEFEAQATQSNKKDILTVTGAIPDNSPRKGIIAFVRNSAGGQLCSSSVALTTTLSQPMPPTCAEKKIEPKVGMQEGILNSLIEIRSKRRDIVIKKVEKLLTEETANRLIALEKGFGLGSGEPLLPITSPALFLHRIEKIRLALESYEIRKTRLKGK